MRSLSEFATQQQVFKNATHLPTFFDSNLVDPGRVFKAFLDDPQAHIRIFYYQYLRLCFEIDNDKSQSYVRKFQELINNPTFQFIFYQDDDPSIYNDTNAKGLISQFFQLLGSGQLSVLEAVNNNPIIDLIMVHFFRTLLILTSQTDNLDNYIPKEQLIDYLSTFFAVDVQFHGECCHYVESDIFVYEQSQAAVYMAYISPYEIENNKYYQSKQQHIQQQKNVVSGQPVAVQPRYQPIAIPPPIQTELPHPRPPVQTYKPTQIKNPNKQSFVASDFLDYTQNHQQLQNKVKNTLKGSNTNLNGYNNYKAEPKPTTTHNQSSQTKLQSLSNPQTNKTLPFIETTSISGSSETKNISEIISQVSGSLQPQHLMKSNPVTRGNVTHLQFEQLPSSNSVTPLNKPTVASVTALQSKPPVASVYQPLIDIPSSSKGYHLPQNSIAQNNQYYTQNNYNSSSSKVESSSSKVEPYSSKVEPYSSRVENTIPQQKQSALATLKQDIYYNPKLQNPSYNQYAYTNTYNQSQKYKSTVSQPAVSKSTTQGPTKKKPFGLNVSQEFTNSLTMKSMAQPFKSSVQSMKSRARNFRTSLANFIK